MSEFVLLTPVKTRPVLVITGILPEHDELLALRLRRLEKLASDAARQVVRGLRRATSARRKACRSRRSPTVSADHQQR